MKQLTLMPDDENNDEVSNEKLRVRYRLGDAEFEAEGPANQVNQHFEAFYAMMGASSKRIEGNIPQDSNLMLLESDKPVSEHTDLSNVVVKTDNQPTTSAAPDLVTFFVQKACDPKTQALNASQHDQFLIIADFMVRHEGKAEVALEEFQQSFDKLREIPVSAPANYTARLSELVEKKKYLYRTKSGYSLTLQGKRHVNSLGG